MIDLGLIDQIKLWPGDRVVVQWDCECELYCGNFPNPGPQYCFDHDPEWGGKTK
jgi:hypothetical protein